MDKDQDAFQEFAEALVSLEVAARVSRDAFQMFDEALDKFKVVAWERRRDLFFLWLGVALALLMIGSMAVHFFG